jgi:Na+/melibiose symporter-like transporter
MFIPAVIIIEKIGIKIALIIGVILSIVGAAIALYVDAAAAEAVGQLIIDAGYPLIVSCGTKIPAKWFPFKERFLATSFAILAGLIGYAMGDASQVAFGKDNRTAFALTLMIAGVAALMLTVLLFKNAPEMPPSISEAKKKDLEGFDLKEEFDTLIHDSGFVLALISSALFIAYSVDIQKGLVNII